MGWAKDLLFLGGYLSPAVLAEEIELERAVQAAATARSRPASTDVPSAAPSASTRAVIAAPAPASPCT